MTHSRKGNGTEQRDESYLTDEVCRKTLDGEYSRAAALLSSPGLAPQTPETADELRGLLQPHAAPELAPPPKTRRWSRPFLTEGNQTRATHHT